MLFENPETRVIIDRIIERVNTHPAWHDDLMQEALIHLWRLEEERPRQRLSWYLQSCRFHLCHYLEAGRSVDSWKRRDYLISMSTEEDEEERGSSLPDDSPATAMSEIHVEQMLEALREHLTPSQQRVLGHLAEGLSSREIGSRLGVSHKAVIKHRRRIALTARQLGISPPLS